MSWGGVMPNLYVDARTAAVVRKLAEAQDRSVASIVKRAVVQAAQAEQQTAQATEGASDV